MLRAKNQLFPKLRGVDVRPYHQNGTEYYLLRDPLELAEGSLLVPQYLGPVLALCDGTMENAMAIDATASVQYGVRIGVEMIEQVLAALDEALLLENDRYRHSLLTKIETYRQRPFRRAALAGLSYPAEQHDLAQLLDDYLAQTTSKPNGRPNGRSRSLAPRHFQPAHRLSAWGDGLCACMEGGGRGGKRRRSGDPDWNRSPR